MKSTTRVERTEEKHSSKQSSGSHKTETKTQSRFPAAKKITRPVQKHQKVSKHAVKHTLIHAHAHIPRHCNKISESEKCGMYRKRCNYQIQQKMYYPRKQRGEEVMMTVKQQQTSFKRDGI
jgi:hypothetical protein